jgi:glyoxylate reductase
VDFETLLQTSDVISVSVPLSSETRHLIGNRELAMCKDGVIIVNTARGKVIDEPALVKALESGKVAAVGLDVFEEVSIHTLLLFRSHFKFAKPPFKSQEPKIHPGLLVHPRATLLPHIGTNTIEAQIEMEQLALNNLIAAVDADKLLTPVWEHKKYFA